jgi:hypothetical protein
VGGEATGIDELTPWAWKAGIEVAVNAPTADAA